MFHSNLLLDLPSELSGEFVGRWLRVEEIVRLDTAFCQTEARETLHRSVFTSSSCIITKVFNRYADNSLSNRMLDWIASRGIRVEHVSVRGENGVLSEQYLRKNGKYITSIHWSDYYPNANASITLVTRYCGNLRSVEYSDGGSENVYPNFLQLLDACPRLESLKALLSCEVDESNIATTLRLNTLRLHSLHLCCDQAATERILSMCVPEAVQRLKISPYVCVSEWSRFSRLRSLDLSGCTLSRHSLMHILDQCRSLVNLNVKPDGSFDSELVEHMPPLRSLSLEDGYMDSESQLFSPEFVQKNKHTLEALYVCGCDGLTSDPINLVLAGCRNLHTLSVDCRHTVDFSLMENLTTLIMDFVKDEDTWGLLQQHCRSLQCLHVIIDNGDEEYTALMIEAVCRMPALRVLYFAGVPSGHKQCYIETAGTLRVLRPTLYIEEDEPEWAWYDLFKLPI